MLRHYNDYTNGSSGPILSEKRQYLLCLGVGLLKNNTPAAVALHGGNKFTYRIKHTLKECYKYRGLLLLLLPAFIWFAVFKYAPMYGVVVAFKNYKSKYGIMGSQWLDPLFKNFTKLFNTPNFWQVFNNTLIISLLKIAITFPAPIIFALMLNEVRNQRYKKVIQTITYLPHFISWVVLAGLLRTLLSPVGGVVNDLIVAFGGEPIKFLMEKTWFRPIVIMSSLWKNIGWGSIVYLAAITGIDPTVYEAADIDGAGRFRKIFSITVPSILPVITIMFILRMGEIMNGGFDQIVNLYNSFTYSVGDILDTYAYRMGLEKFDYSYSTAITLFKNIIGLGMVLLTNYITKRLGGEGVY